MVAQQYSLPEIHPAKYSEDDLHCFNNLQWEMDGLLQFLTDCNQRKLSWFKLSLGVFSIVTTGLTALIAYDTKEASFTFPHVFDAMIGIVIVAVGLINLAIVKELISIHSSRIISLRQMNCLRQAMDSIRFKKCEGKYPDSWQDLRVQSSLYWKTFGQHRKLHIENSKLRESERSFIQSPDRIMIFIVTFLSLLLISFPAAYGIYSHLVYDKNTSFTLGVLSGVLSSFFVIYVCYEIHVERRTLLESLGVISQ